jgi:hypothetical protein
VTFFLHGQPSYSADGEGGERDHRTRGCQTVSRCRKPIVYLPYGCSGYQEMLTSENIIYSKYPFQVRSRIRFVLPL